MNRLALPGGIDIKGLEFILKDPSDFGMYAKMKDITYKELIECGAVICGGVETVREQLKEVLTDFGIGNLHVMLQFGSMPKKLAFQNIDLFCKEVKPHLANIWKEDGYEHRWLPERLKKGNN